MAGGKFQDTVELIIAAREQAAATVEKGRKKVREANKGQEQFGGKLIQNAIRATAAFGTLELGLGGVNAALLRVNIDKTIGEVNDIEAATQHVADNGKALDKSLPKAIATLDTDIEKLEATIAELQEAVAAKRSELTATEGEVQHLADCRKLVADVEAEPAHSLRKLVWTVASSGSHGYE
mgnify:CR=1 FL=1